MTEWSLLAPAWFGMASMMLVLWLIQLRTKDASLVDVVWAAGLGLLGIFYALVASGEFERRVMLACVVSFWSFRLAGYLLFNRVLGKAEDRRYRSLRAQWGRNAPRNFFFFYQAQGLLDVLLSIPFLVIAFNPRPSIHFVEILGLVVWATGIFGETVADRQLAAFRSNPDHRGRTCRDGLWRYSRHPNYFFEWLIWCGFALMAWPAPNGWMGIVSPIIMLFLILKVTGVPPTEAQALASRGDDYRDYQRTTSVFVPWFPKSN
jgi:steroid 5-alpha reductase family enzyme